LKLSHFRASKKVPSCHLGQVNFPLGKEPFILTCPMGKGPGELSVIINKNKSKLQLAQGKQNLRAACPKAIWNLSSFQALNLSAL